MRFPERPANVPADLTKPTTAYKRHAWLAMGALIAFVALYLSFTVWFSWTTYRFVTSAMAGGADAYIGWLSALPAAFFSLFFIKGLFIFERHDNLGAIEITEDDQPSLHAFVMDVAREAGAPRPHRIFVSSRVNAAVFYDLSLLNFLIPTRKNLEIGLGLVNALTTSELKAVIGHEFGHFAQRTMAVGRWVYISQKIAAAIVQKRDALDHALLWISATDLRVAWIGWVMRLIVWSLRAVIDTAFRLVVLAERALSHEMELNADLVAVSVSGSDALIHALHKLQAADEAWDDAVGFVATERARGHIVSDLFSIQERFVTHVRRVLDDPTHGEAPPLPTSPEEHRVFAQTLGQPPKMWASHPPNRDREDNAKRRYISAPLETESAWSLFDDPQSLREEMTATLLSLLEDEDTPRGEDTELDDALARVDEQFDRPAFDRCYQGVYLGRAPLRAFRTVAETYDEAAEAEAAALLDALYPDDLSDVVGLVRDLDDEHSSLEGLRDGFLTAAGGVIQHRGRRLRRKDLTDAIETVDEERAAARARLAAHDRACRTAHRLAARALGGKWEKYLKSLTRCLHYVTHTAADLVDASGHLDNVWSVVIADGRVSSGERERLTSAASELYQALSSVDEQRDAVRLPAAVRKRLDIKRWAEVIPPLSDLGEPDQDNIGEWLTVTDDWVRAYTSPLMALQGATLDVLLEAEQHVATCFREGTDPGEAPRLAKAPTHYVTQLEGEERPRQKTLDLWDRFQIADGFVPGLARFSVAAAIVGGVLAMGTTVGSPVAVVYNGLRREVVVHVGDEDAKVAPLTHVRLDVDPGTVRVEAETADGVPIESFEVVVDSGFQTYVYNVASASPLVEWTAHYGGGEPPPPNIVGARRWVATEAEHVFEKPPESIQSHSDGGQRLVMEVVGDKPLRAAGMVDNDDDVSRMALAHARWDELSAPNTSFWLAMGTDFEGMNEVLAERLKETPREVALLRIEQEVGNREAVCARHRELADAEPESADLAYLKVRCMEKGPERDAAFARGLAKSPNHPWFANAVAFEHAANGRWTEAASLYAIARKHKLVAGAAEQEARVRRCIQVDDPAQTFSLEELAKHWPPLGLRVAADFMEADGHPIAATLLARGSLEEALTECGDEGCEHIIRLVAASEGAQGFMIESLQSLGDIGLADSNMWSGYALALREGFPTEPYLERIRNNDRDGDVERMIAFASSKELVSDPEQALKKLGKLSPERRGHAYVMAIVLLGEKAPEPWRRYAKALLFDDERPYFR